MSTEKSASKEVCVLSHWMYPCLTNQVWGADLHEATRTIEVWNAVDVMEWGVKLLVLIPDAMGTKAMNARSWGSIRYSGEFATVNAVLHRDGRYAINPKLVDWSNTRVVDPIA